MESPLEDHKKDQIVAQVHSTLDGVENCTYVHTYVGIQGSQ